MATTLLSCISLACNRVQLVLPLEALRDARVLERSNEQFNGLPVADTLRLRGLRGGSGPNCHSCQRGAERRWREGAQLYRVRECGTPGDGRCAASAGVAEGEAKISLAGGSPCFL